MSETVDFALRLQDQVSGAARSASTALQKMQAQTLNAAQKMGRAQAAAERMNTAFDAARVTSVSKALANQAREAEKAARATRALGLAQLQANKMNAEMDKRKTFLGGLTAKLPFRAVSDYAQGAFFGELAASAAMNIAGAFLSGAKAAVSLVSDGIVGAFREGGKREDLELSYKYLRGGAAGAKSSLDDIDRFSKLTRFDDDDIAQMMRPLFKAGMTQKQARTAFASAADADATGAADPMEMIGMYSKIMMKGGITLKSLADVVNIPDFGKTLGKRLGVSSTEALKRAEKPGGVNPLLLIKTIEDAQEKRQGAKLATPAIERAQTMSARLSKLSNLPSQFLKEAVHSPYWEPLEKKLGDVLGALDPSTVRGKRMTESLLGVFNQVATGLNEALTPENLTSFANGVASAGHELSAMLETMKATARFIRHPFETTSDAISKSLVRDPSTAKIAGIDQLRQIGRYGDAVRAKVAELKPSEFDDLMRLGKEEGFDYSSMAPTHIVQPVRSVSSGTASATRNAPTVNVTVTGGINVNAVDAKTSAEMASEIAGMLAGHVEHHVTRMMERSANEGGGSSR